MVHIQTQIAMRKLGASDGLELHRLAERDSAQVPHGDLLGAEADGHLVAAVSLEDGSVIADPFRRSGEAVELLRLRAAHLRGEGSEVRSRMRRIVDGLARGHAHAGLGG